jgi:hypothetical protein
MHLTPEETRALFGACDAATAYIKGGRMSHRGREALMHDNLHTFVSVCEKLRNEVTRLEQGMARPHSDKIYVHAALTPEAHEALHTTLERRFNGKVPPGAIGAYLGELILDDAKQILDACGGAL